MAGGGGVWSVLGWEHFSPGRTVAPVEQAPAVFWSVPGARVCLLLGDCPTGGAESHAFAGEVGKVDHTGSREQVGEVAL